MIDTLLVVLQVWLLVALLVALLVGTAVRHRNQQVPQRSSMETAPREES